MTGVREAVPLLEQVAQTVVSLEVGTKAVPERDVEARVQRLLIPAEPIDEPEVGERARVRAGGAEPFVAELLKRGAARVVADVALERDPVGGIVLRRQAPDEAVGDVRTHDVLEVVERVLVLGPAPLQIGTDEESP